MCSIIGAWSKDDVIDLCKLNEYRGQHSHSVSYYNPQTGEMVVRRAEGALDYDTIFIPKNNYCIVHMQAPTGEINGIHPAEVAGKYLWHNGIVKQSNICKLQVETMCSATWDTELILRAYIKDKHLLSEVDGTFSCLMYAAGDLFLFRNEISPMFFDRTLCVSSTKFEGSIPTDPNAIHYMDMFDSTLVGVGQFKTANNPYFFGE